MYCYKNRSCAWSDEINSNLSWKSVRGMVLLLIMS